MKQLDIFIAFFRSSMLGYGGGPTTIPLVQKEVVERFKWMDNEEFGDILAIGNTLPGPINTKMAGYIGYRIGGIPGTINAILATILPTIFLMIILLTTFTTFKDVAWVHGMAKGVLPVVGVMLAVLTKDFLKTSIKGLKWGAVLLHVIIALVLIEFLHIHPAILIASLLLFALLKPVKKGEKDKQKKGRSA
ncbi:chromate transporter [Domibacillus epiphyticus]|uniref:Chromate transporter n=1 Tax=Domibacillus epiphyticus TaxID=1714355 RepID=A0A1V2A956_9BACI|nr:chromate transporter [Domibacillus epiphyticus]OMP67354.1 chromate transporter [Domibacillus epiphyticus]